MGKRKTYTSQFKHEAVRLMEVRTSLRLKLPANWACGAISSTNGKNN